jgi:TusA-related sulfurtransferase
MTTTVDARGLSCPQPVLEFLAAVTSSRDDEILVLVDTEASMENVSRAARSRECTVREVLRQGDEYRLAIVRNRS